MWRLQAALGLSGNEFAATPIEILEQFAFAKGEEVVLNRYHMAESVSVAIADSFAETDVLSEYMQNLILLVVEKRVPTREEILEHNERNLKKVTSHG